MVERLAREPFTLGARGRFPLGGSLAGASAIALVAQHRVVGVDRVLGATQAGLPALVQGVVARDGCGGYGLLRVLVLELAQRGLFRVRLLGQRSDARTRGVKRREGGARAAVLVPAEVHEHDAVLVA